MTLSELKRRNLLVKCCLENPNKSKSKTVEYYKLFWNTRNPLSHSIKRYALEENVEKNSFFFQKCALPSSKARCLEKTNSAKLYGGNFFSTKSNYVQMNDEC
jgi:hypothetical protein